MPRRLALALVSTLAWPAAAAAQTVVLIDAAANLAYTEQTASGPATTGTRIGGDVRTGLALQSVGSRLAWRADYDFAGNLSVDGPDTVTRYSNGAGLVLVAQPSNRTSMSLAASASQGGTAFQLSQRPADAGQPSIRAPGDPDRINGMLSEVLLWNAAPDVRVHQALSGTFTAPQDDLGLYGVAVNGSVGFERKRARDAIGAELSPTVSVLTPLVADPERYVTITTTLLGRWSRDLGPLWNAQVSLGVGQALTLTGSYPLAILPSGSLSASYSRGIAAASFLFSHATTNDLQTGTLALTDQVTARGSMTFGPRWLPRTLSASAGFLHSVPIGEAASRVAAGTGNAVQADVGLIWPLSERVLATLRYSLAYQFGQDGGLAPSLASVLLVGITGRYSNVSARTVTPMPAIQGQRVDDADAVGFPEHTPTP